MIGTGQLIASLITGASIEATNTALGIGLNVRNEKLNHKRFEREIELANTAHQREVQDLRDAGLNPILSTGTAGAAVPQQAAAEYQSPSIGSGITDALNTAASLAVADKQADNLGYDAALKKIQVDAFNTASPDEKKQLLQGIRDEMLKRGAPRNAIEASYLGLRKGLQAFFGRSDDNKNNNANPPISKKMTFGEKMTQDLEAVRADHDNKVLDAAPIVVPKNLMQEYKKEHDGHTPTAKDFELWRRRRNARNYKK